MDAETIKALPFSKSATPAQMILLALCCIGLILIGIKLGNDKKDITDGIDRLDVKVSYLAANAVNKADFELWIARLDKANSKLDGGRGLVVPDLPVRQALVIPGPSPSASEHKD